MFGRAALSKPHNSLPSNAPVHHAREVFSRVMSLNRRGCDVCPQGGSHLSQISFVFQRRRLFGNSLKPIRFSDTTRCSKSLADRAKTPRHFQRCQNFAACDRAERKKSRKSALRATIRSLAASFRTVCLSFARRNDASRRFADLAGRDRGRPS